MVEQQIDHFLMTEGYTKIPSNLPEFTVYFRMENHYVNVFHVIDCQRNLYITEDQYVHLKEKIEALFAEKGISEIHILSLIIGKSTENTRRISGEDVFCWLADPYEKRLIVYENQVSDFYGMRKKLEYALMQEPEEDSAHEKNSRLKQDRRMPGNIPYVTAGIVLVNIVIFLICAFTGDLLYNIGAFGAVDFMENKEYYRILTSMFLHWDINHLISNMVVLYYLGEVVEKHFGRIEYGILYIMTGICGNLLSLIYEVSADAHIHSVGASGAVFGIIGALLVLVIVHRGHLHQITIGRLLFMIAYSLYSGFASSDINNAAHMGGFLCGIVAAVIMWFINKVWVSRKR